MVVTQSGIGGEIKNVTCELKKWEEMSVNPKNADNCLLQSVEGASFTQAQMCINKISRLCYQCNHLII